MMLNRDVCNNCRNKRNLKGFLPFIRISPLCLTWVCPRIVGSGYTLHSYVTNTDDPHGLCPYQFEHGIAEARLNLE